MLSTRWLAKSRAEAHLCRQASATDVLEDFTGSEAALTSPDEHSVTEVSVPGAGKASLMTDGVNLSPTLGSSGQGTTRLVGPESSKEPLGDKVDLLGGLGVDTADERLLTTQAKKTDLKIVLMSPWKPLVSCDGAWRAYSSTSPTVQPRPSNTKMFKLT